VTELPKFFAEGLASVVAPCVLPLLPTYLAAIAAVDAERLGERRAATRVLRATVPFLLGLATVFVALGLGVGALTSSGIADRQTIDEVAGILQARFRVQDPRIGMDVPARLDAADARAVSSSHGSVSPS